MEGMKKVLIVAIIFCIIAFLGIFIYNYMRVSSISGEDEFLENLNYFNELFQVEEWNIEEFKNYYRGEEENLKEVRLPIDDFREEASVEDPYVSDRVIYYNQEKLRLWFDDYTTVAGNITIYWWSPRE